VKISHIQRALADYAAGRLDRAIQTLDWIAITAEITPEAGQAANILSMVKMVRQLHTQALQAQKQKKFARALECWDRLLAVDMELVGERPSFFARQAEQRVQALSYEHALRAYQLKNYKKVKQLCQVILQIDPKHPQALTLLAKIEPKA
jgi:tetratricopeptide (TPR) repeat protein